MYFVSFGIFCKHFVFVHCAEWGRLVWFPGGGGGGVGVRRLCRFCGRFAQGFGETVHILGISSLGNWVKFLYFVQWLSLSFVFVSMFVICLFIIIIIGWR